jgi:hypothetical protein
MVKDISTIIAAVIGLLMVVVLWLCSIVASLAVPALAVWALGHFAFGWW